MLNNRKIKILIAEDDYLVSMMIKGLLEQIGYTVIGEAVNGEEAVEMTESLKPSIVLMDVRMPGMNGIEATKLIYERCPTPVVMLTAYESSELVEQATEAGAGAYLTKPLNMQEVTRSISIAMARFEDMMTVRRLNKELEARNQQLETALAEVNVLSRLLPICASCKKVRDDDGYWQKVEKYLHERAGIEFSHGFCPDCLTRLYPNVSKKDEDEKEDEL
ncbi:response regulator [Anaerolineales bacterium HSG6]|nr:response regulator [Anaerolineales bacterium HSG6]MDM8530989.1 response regulator [Anaerolineales bacterium HSG25]